jgi:hypothetical protein
MNNKTQWLAVQIMVGILLASVAGCVAPSTQPASPPTPTLPTGWVTDSATATQGKCGYAIDHPAEMGFNGQTDYSRILNVTTTDPSGPVPNLIYISVIPDGFQSDEPGVIYNYDPGETQTLLSMQVGESRSLRSDPNLAPSFTYTRLPDITIASQAAKAYENTQPWEFPPSTKEIRYYIEANGCTYLIGGYLSTVGSGQVGAISEELFDQIITRFRITP